jgi:hypothetical protein
MAEEFFFENAKFLYSLKNIFKYVKYEEIKIFFIC